jgi:hypothetical protein
MSTYKNILPVDSVRLVSKFLAKDAAADILEPLVDALLANRLVQAQIFTALSESVKPVFPFPETVPNFVCHFKGSLHNYSAQRCLRASVSS